MPRRTLRALALALTLVAGFALATVAFAADGEPDPDFGTDGRVSLAFDELIEDATPVVDEDEAGNVAVVQAGAGWGGTSRALAGRGIRVWRLTANGAPDATFRGGQPVDVSLARFPVGGISVQDVRATASEIRALVSLELDGPIGKHVLVTVPITGEPTVVDLNDPQESCREPRGARFTATGVQALYACEEPRLERAGGDAPWVLLTFDLAGKLVGEPRPLGTLGSAEAFDLDVDAQDRLVLLSGHRSSDPFRYDWRVSRPGLEETLVFREETSDEIAPTTIEPASVSTYADGGFVVGGMLLAGGAWVVQRFDAAGAPVSGFGTGGTATHEGGLLGGDALATVTALSDGGVLAVGRDDGQGVAVLRLTATGARDTEFGPEGIRRFSPEGWNALRSPGDALEDAAGRLVLPFNWTPGSARRGTATPTSGVQVVRLGKPRTPPSTDTGTTPETTPTTPTTPTTTTPTTTQPGQPVQQQQSATPPPVTVTAQSRTRRTLRSCLSRRSFTIRLRPKALRSAKVTVAGKDVEVTRRKGRLTARVDLRKLEQASFSVKVVAVDAQGRTVRETRTYRTCRYGKNGPKVKGGSIITVVQG